MAEIQTYAQWTSFVNNLQSELRTTVNSIKERNQKIEQGIPRQQLTRQHVQNRRSLENLERQVEAARNSLRTLQEDRQVLPQQYNTSERKLTTISSQIEEAKAQLNKYSEAGPAQPQVQGETEQTRAMSDQELVTESDRIRQQQDEMADQLHSRLQVEVEKARNIGNELDSQDKKLDEVNGRMEVQNVRIQQQTRDVIHLKQQTACCTYIVIVILVIILVVQVATNNFSMGY